MADKPQSPWVKILTMSDEQAMALTAAVLNQRYPNCVFEAVETGTGLYELNVGARYQDVMSAHGLNMISSSAMDIYFAAGIIAKELNNASQT